MSKKVLIGIIIGLSVIIMGLLGCIIFLLSRNVETSNQENIIENQQNQDDIQNSNEEKEEQKEEEKENKEDKTEENSNADDEEDKNEEDQTNTNTNTNTESNKPSSTGNNAKISDNWEDGEFLYDGKKVKLICNFSELATNLGLEFQDEEKNEYILNPRYTTSGGSCTIGNSENIVVNLLNTTSESKKYPECDVDVFSINIYSLKRKGDKNYSDIQLSKGITWDSTLEEVLNAYGEPKRRTDDSNFTILNYESNGNKLHFTFYNDYGLTSVYYSID